MTNSTDPDQLASTEYKGRAYPDSAGLGLRNKCINSEHEVSSKVENMIKGK